MSVLTRASVCLLSVVAGCIAPYRSASPDEPHAVIKFRRVYNDRPGPNLRELALINGEYAAMERTVEPEAAPHTQAVLVHPQWASLEFHSTFFHTETRSVQESYTVQEPYTTTESYRCGTYDSPRTCTRSVTRYRSRTKWRTVTKSVQVVDDACAGTVGLQPEVGHVYLLQFTYQGDGVCELTCFEQQPGQSGMTQRRCPTPSS